MLKKNAVRLAVSLDVEEEGLFGGRYALHPPPVTNTARLARLAPLMSLARPTLFCAYSIFDQPRALADVLTLRDKFPDRLEIGAHLHHWNTPPLPAARPAFAASVPASGIPAGMLSAKLENLLATAEKCCGERPNSFRMGRWDILRAHWPLLAEAGITCDASVRPLHSPLRGPDHFAAPANPYRIPAAGKDILEIPLTVTPLCSSLPGLLERLPGWGARARAGLKNWGALVLLPVYHPLWLMRFITRLFVARGGQVLSLTWHSSEMMPGGAPHVPNDAAVDALMDKIYRYLRWLHQNFSTRAGTMRELTAEMGAEAPLTPAPTGDWTCE